MQLKIKIVLSLNVKLLKEPIIEINVMVAYYVKQICKNKILFQWNAYSNNNGIMLTSA